MHNVDINLTLIKVSVVVSLQQSLELIGFFVIDNVQEYLITVLKVCNLIRLRDQLVIDKDLLTGNGNSLKSLDSLLNVINRVRWHCHHIKSVVEICVHLKNDIRRLTAFLIRKPGSIMRIEVAK